MGLTNIRTRTLPRSALNIRRSGSWLLPMTPCERPGPIRPHPASNVASTARMKQNDFISALSRMAIGVQAVCERTGKNGGRKPQNGARPLCATRWIRTGTPTSIGAPKTCCEADEGKAIQVWGVRFQLRCSRRPARAKQADYKGCDHRAGTANSNRRRTERRSNSDGSSANRITVPRTGRTHCVAILMGRSPRPLRELRSSPIRGAASRLDFRHVHRTGT